ncbi:MAG: hypothetical protein ICV77_13000 [Cyanobacteria bacterium Co-bin8]|nr:hypothetical protein [Cyanobacteria bacterium Co-bin8]
MTTLQWVASGELVDRSTLRPTFHQRPLKNSWGYGRAYVVVAMIAPLVLLGLLLVHLNTLGQQWGSWLWQMARPR